MTAATLVAMESIGESLRKAEMGMVARREADLNRTCFFGQCNRAVEAVVWFGVWLHVVSKMEQSFLNKIDPVRAVKNVSQILEYPHDGRRWKEVIYMSRKCHQVGHGEEHLPYHLLSSIRGFHIELLR